MDLPTNTIVCNYTGIQKHTAAVSPSRNVAMLGGSKLGFRLIGKVGPCMVVVHCVVKYPPTKCTPMQWHHHHHPPCTIHHTMTTTMYDLTCPVNPNRNPTSTNSAGLLLHDTASIQNQLNFIIQRFSYHTLTTQPFALQLT